MKKAVFITSLLMATLLLFAGCLLPEELGLGEDGNKLPGTWYKPKSMRMVKNCNDNIWGSYTDSKVVWNNIEGSYTYTFANAGDMYWNGSSDEIKIHREEIALDNNITGFKACATSTENTYYGYAFDMYYTQHNGNYGLLYYRILFGDGEYTLSFIDNIYNKEIELVPWTKNSAIKKSSSQNNILIYTKDNEDIVIKVNDKELYTITGENVYLSGGQVGILCCVSYQNYRNNKSINTTYNFQEFQK